MPLSKPKPAHRRLRTRCNTAPNCRSARPLNRARGTECQHKCESRRAREGIAPFGRPRASGVAVAPRTHGRHRDRASSALRRSTHFRTFVDEPRFSTPMTDVPTASRVTDRQLGEAITWRCIGAELAREHEPSNRYVRRYRAVPRHARLRANACVECPSGHLAPRCVRTRCRVASRHGDSSIGAEASAVGCCRVVIAEGLG